MSIQTIFEALNDYISAMSCRRIIRMDKRVPLFEYEIYAVRKPKSVESDDLPRKRER
jgi:hypothetical protein